jgi:post-segregation antitoxin (ccd killing protein)
MARVNVYLPDDLAEAARDAGLNVSALTQEALRDRLRARTTTAWLETLPSLGARLTHDDVLVALDEVRAEQGDDWPNPAPGSSR